MQFKKLLVFFQGIPEIDQGNEESKLTDWVKLACLLCLRQFPSKEKLQK